MRAGSRFIIRSLCQNPNESNPQNCKKRYMKFNDASKWEKSYSCVQLLRDIFAHSLSTKVMFHSSTLITLTNSPYWILTLSFMCIDHLTHLLNGEKSREIMCNLLICVCKKYIIKENEMKEIVLNCDILNE
jgi:hypothetical protein